MKITLSTESPVAVKVDVVAVGVRSRRPAQDPNVVKLDRAMGGALVQAIKDEGYKANRGSTLGLLGRGKVKAKRVLLVGLGDDDAPATLRRYAVTAARKAATRGSLALVAPDDGETRLEVLAEGAVLGAYHYARYLTGDRRPKNPLSRVVLLVPSATAARRRAVSAGVAVGECVNLARDLVNCPANDLTATDLASFASTHAKKHGVACKVWDKRGIKKLGMPLLLAVNSGSTQEPRFIHLTYKPPGRRRPRVVFVGKGLTFDSGGLCIKPAISMLGMKADMGGAATTLAVVLAAARLKLPLEVHGVIGSTDNMTGGDAYKPGDVFPSRLGKTVEIINTDAEGRLVLADALAYAVEQKPDYLVDHATLTGACQVALGNYRAGLFSNDDELGNMYEAAADASGESYWRMPLDADLADELKSSIADLQHTGSRYGGAITAALFLSEFVGDTRWAHLDIAGPAYLERQHGIYPKGGSGFGILTALELLKKIA